MNEIFPSQDDVSRFHFLNSHLIHSCECHPACQLCGLAICSKMPPHQSVCSTVYFFHYAVKTFFAIQHIYKHVIMQILLLLLLLSISQYDNHVMMGRKYDNIYDIHNSPTLSVIELLISNGYGCKLKMYCKYKAWYCAVMTL